MSVSGSGFESEVVVRCEVILNLSKEADGEECRANNYVESMEARSYEKCGSVDSVSDCEGGFIVFYSLEECEVPS